MARNLGPLYHWSPRERLESIKRLGLVPGKRNVSGPTYLVHDDPSSGEFFQPGVCLSPDPATAWGYSHGTWKTVGTFDLWQVYLVDEDDVHRRRKENGRLVEVRVHNRIVKSRLVWIGERTVLERNKQMTEEVQVKRPVAVKAENGIWVAHKEGNFAFGKTRKAAIEQLNVAGAEAFDISANNLALIMAHQRLTGQAFPWPKGEGEDYQILRVGMEQWHLIRLTKTDNTWEIVLPFIPSQRDAKTLLELVEGNPDKRLGQEHNLRVISTRK